MSEPGTKSQCTCGCMGVGPMLTEAVRHFAPSSEVTQHFRAAHLEVLKGLRAMLDQHIAAQTESRPHGQGTKIHVE
jgi:hypothetical protein